MSLSGTFLWDDETLIQNNPAVVHPSVSSAFIGPLSSSFKTYYRPLQTLSFQLDFRLWGLNPFGFHLTNVLLHLGNCFLLYCLFLYLGAEGLAAFIAALLFAVHPLMTEPVNYISSRADLLMAFFLLLSMNALFCVRTAAVWVSLTAFALALLSKEAAVVFPLVALASGTATGRIRLKSVYPHMALAIAYVVLRLAFQVKAVSLGIPWQRLLWTDAVMTGTAVQLFFFPVGLHKNWIVVLAGSFADVRVIRSVILLLCIVCAVVFLSRKRRSRLPVLGLLWFLIMLIPSFSSVVLTLAGKAQPRNTVLSEAWLYFASMGMVLVFAGLMTPGFVIRRKMAAGCVLALVCVLSVMTVRRNLVWAGDPAVFFEETLRYHPLNAGIHYNLANVYARRGAMAPAEREYKAALALEPQHARCLNNLCSLYLRWGKNDHAIDACNRALAIDPDLTMAQENLRRAQGS